MIGTLRGRLLALFFLVSLIPSLGLTFFVTQYLARSLAALQHGGLVSGDDAPRQVSGIAAVGSDRAILTGYQLDPEISSEIVALQRNLSMYKRLGVYTWLSQRSLWIFAGLWSLVLGAVSFGLAYLVSKGIAKPIVALREGMAQASQGDLSHRVKPSGTSEVRFLAASFNRMVEEIQSSRR